MYSAGNPLGRMPCCRGCMNRLRSPGQALVCPSPPHCRQCRPHWAEHYLLQTLSCPVPARVGGVHKTLHWCVEVRRGGLPTPTTMARPIGSTIDIDRHNQNIPSAHIDKLCYKSLDYKVTMMDYDTVYNLFSWIRFGLKFERAIAFWLDVPGVQQV